jgi:hypothetical protein
METEIMKPRRCGARIGRRKDGFAMSMFSSGAYQALLDAGWTENRQTDTSAYEQALQKKGYSPSAAVLGFLGRFGGLNMRYGKDGRFDLELNALEPGKALVAHAFSERLGRPLYYLGVFLSGTHYLLMDDEGVVYMHLDYLIQDYGPKELFLAAPSGEGAIEWVFQEDGRHLEGEGQIVETDSEWGSAPAHPLYL